MTVYYETLDEVAVVARPYPSYLLEGAKTGLCLFSAAFMGHNDVIHFWVAGVDTTCIDIDTDRLEMMRDLYPSRWEFVCCDAWKFAAAAAERGDRWDVVSADTGRGSPTERSLANLDAWCDIAEHAVVATFEDGQTYECPAGWSAELVRRNSEVFWLVLIRVVPA